MIRDGIREFHPELLAKVKIPLDELNKKSRYLFYEYVYRRSGITYATLKNLPLLN